MHSIREIANQWRALYLLRSHQRKMDAGSALGTLGFKTLSNVLTLQECESIRSDDSYISEELPDQFNPAYVVSRRNRAGYDQGVFQLMNYHCLKPWIADRLGDQVLEWFRNEVGMPMQVSSYTVQLDLPDTKTKRPFHNDGFFPNYKLFVYLTDVDGPENGPYTVVAGSHREVGKKALNLIANIFGRSRALDDLTIGYPDSRARSFTSPAGSAVMSCQQLAHKGWPAHVERNRYMLVVYLRPGDPDEPRTPFQLGRNLAMTEPINLSIL